MSPLPSSELDDGDDWRSIIRDACDLRDLQSHGDAIKNYRWRILGDLQPHPKTDTTALAGPNKMLE
ncbi:hypothetical protein A3B61_04115 [Candidatus Peribacteria bacterium RIFCSPLOWO2_01_FULL_53_10]|nr:MAG: hypothetical protein A3B61_04115 [Candidatus Peribacteria bacterium RIFCSPLOWO2_01_FULL_53_10]